jgi:hypothetical protein
MGGVNRHGAVWLVSPSAPTERSARTIGDQIAEDLTNLTATAPVASATIRALHATFFINHGEILAN